jgi:hypothetical protein
MDFRNDRKQVGSIHFELQYDVLEISSLADVLDGDFA